LLLGVVLTLAILVVRVNPVPGGGRDQMKSKPAWTEASIEVLFVVIGSSTCGISASPTSRAALASAWQSIHREAESIGLPFRSIGIAVEHNLASGLRFLNSLGDFDEISVGRAWDNTAAWRYTVSAFGGRAVVPQILVMVRRTDPQLPRSGESLELLDRREGLFEIERWAPDQGTSYLPLIGGTNENESE
jgi:hypothetical protein